MKDLYEDNYKQNFSFGKNWKDFLSKLNENRIKEAEFSLRSFLNKKSLNGLNFIDIGCGSGLFSLCAKRLGAKSVMSVDIDDSSVLCARQLKEKYYKEDDTWQIIKGSALDENFVKGLGKFDIVYSWGVLHHTGDMWGGIKNTEYLLDDGSIFYLALYNKKEGFQGSLFWKKAKKIYSQGGFLIRKIIEFLYVIQFFIKGLVKFENRIKYILNYESARGMNWWNDVKDWLGGYPYEYAKTEEIVNYFKNRKYDILKIKDCINGTGCNEFLIIKK